MVNKLHIKKKLKEFILEVNNILEKLIGNKTCEEITLLVEKNNVNLEKFDHSFNDTDGYIAEYFKKLKNSITYACPLFDERSNKLISSAKNQV